MKAAEHIDALHEKLLHGQHLIHFLEDNVDKQQSNL